MLAKAIYKHRFASDKICIVEETNITFNPKGQKNSCNEGRIQIGVLSSANKDEVVKAEMCFFLRQELSCLVCLFLPGNERGRNFT